jgi:hypothetical protein
LSAPKSKIDPNIAAFILRRILDHRLVCGHDGWFFDRIAEHNRLEPKAVRGLLRQDLHTQFFLTSRQVKDALDEVLGAIEQKIRT